MDSSKIVYKLQGFLDRFDQVSDHGDEGNNAAIMRFRDFLLSMTNSDENGRILISTDPVG
jgi:hypothetical protein